VEHKILGLSDFFGQNILDHINCWDHINFLDHINFYMIY